MAFAVVLIKFVAAWQRGGGSFMLFRDIGILDEQGGYRQGMFVGVSGERIVYLGESAPTEDFGAVYEGRGRLLMPGFYNAHAHSPMTLMRGYGENLGLHAWLQEKIFPFEDLLTGEDVYHATLLAMAESFRYGIVSTTDMYFFARDIARAALSCGAKLNLGRAIVSFEEEESLKDNRFFQEAVDLRREFDGAGNGRIMVDMALHAEYTSTEKLVRQLGEYTKETGGSMHVHVSETREEQEGCKTRRGGRTPIRYFADLGLLDVRTTAAHCVWAEPEDMEILAEKGTTVASCPVSNLKLSSGICNVPALWEKGIPVAIGTDGVASNNSLNYLSDMKLFALVNKERRGDPRLITPAETLRAATICGAISQGREDCGRLAEGCRADLIVLDVAGPHMQPVHEMVTNLIYSASGSDVVLTMVDGTVVYRDGLWPTLDLERAIFETNRAGVRILEALA
jgi:5-methylthioadenosine/S-adenosylhomocysteine deaminase